MQHCTALALIAALAAPAALAGPLDEPHLPILPRTAEEAARVATVTALPADPGALQPHEGLPGGAATVRATGTANAFSLPSANIGFARELDFRLGNALFRKLWVAAPASTIASDGLGPLYNARSCQSCHIKDGRGHTPQGPQEDALSVVMRLSIPGTAARAEIEGYLATLPEPVYGGQVQGFTLPGQIAEGRPRVTWTEETVALAGGETATLRRPLWQIESLGYGPLHPEVMTSIRVAPQMIGLGLIEAVPAADILALADEGDADGDGISGRANIVWSAEFDRPMLGRFGHKAGTPTLRQQTADAFATDIGIGSPLHPQGWGDCTPAQTACRAAPDDSEPDRNRLEIDAEGLDLLTFYSRNLAVPARRAPDDAQVLRGKAAFHAAGCPACHRPAFVTHRLQDQPAQSFQLIWPYTDLLLHDMGEGLADHRPEGRADGREWRTAPLWGIGLTAQVTGVAEFLHDGRARNLLEAILWHGGEAQAARDAVVAMPPPDRAALLRFLESL